MRTVSEPAAETTYENAIVVFAGRGERVDVSAQRDLRWLDHDDVLPANLGRVLEEVAGLVVLDALAFPFEAMGLAERGVPLTVRMPSGLGPRGLFDVLEEDLFTHLTTLDSVVVDPARWEPISRRYHLPDDRRLEEDPGDVAVLRGALTRFNRDRKDLERERVEGAALAGGLPALALYGRYPRLRAAKARRWTDTNALRRVLGDLARLQPKARPLHVLEIATIAGRLLPALPRETAGYRAFETWGERARVVDVGGETFAVEPLEQHLRLPVEPESTDILLVAADVATNPRHLLTRLVAESVRAVRPGGFLVFLSDFVPKNQAEQEAMIGANRFVELAISASGQRLVLHRVESVRHPGDDLHRTGIVVLQRIGAPSRW